MWNDIEGNEFEFESSWDVIAMAFRVEPQHSVQEIQQSLHKQVNQLENSLSHGKMPLTSITRVLSGSSRSDSILISRFTAQARLESSPFEFASASSSLPLSHFNLNFLLSRKMRTRCTV